MEQWGPTGGHFLPLPKSYQEDQDVTCTCSCVSQTGEGFGRKIVGSGTLTGGNSHMEVSGPNCMNESSLIYFRSYKSPVQD